MTKNKDRLFRIIAALDRHFASDSLLPADQDRWRELRRHIIRMNDALDQIQTTLREPLTPEIACKLGGYARLGLGE